MSAIQSEHDDITPRRSTDKEIERGLLALEAARVEREAQLARRGDVLFPESWEDIRRDREERSRHLLDL